MPPSSPAPVVVVPSSSSSSSSSSASSEPPPAVVAKRRHHAHSPVTSGSKTTRHPFLFNLVLLISLASFGLLGGQKINLSLYVRYLKTDVNIETAASIVPSHTLPETMYDSPIITNTTVQSSPSSRNSYSSSSSGGTSSSFSHGERTRRGTSTQRFNPRMPSKVLGQSKSSHQHLPPPSQQQRQRPPPPPPKRMKLSPVDGIEWEQLQNPLQYHALPLEFVHIPKTGGTSIEAAFAPTGYSWGFCKYMDRASSLTKSLGAVACPDGRPPMGSLTEYRQRLAARQKPICQGAMPWHLPPWRFDSLPWNMNMFQNATLFAVVRNPYDRVISEYYFENFVYRLPQQQQQQMQQKGPLGRPMPGFKPAPSTATRPKLPPLEPSVAHLNFWAQKILLERRKFINQYDPWNMTLQDYGLHGGHWIPQYEFCYHPLTGEQRVQHVLKFETLQEDFEALMQQYNLSDLVQLPHVMTSSGARDTTTTPSTTASTSSTNSTGSTSTNTTTNNSSSSTTTTTTTTTTSTTSTNGATTPSTSPKLTRNDLYDSTKQMIELLFGQDFDVFGYTRESVGNLTSQELWDMVYANNHKNSNSQGTTTTTMPRPAINFDRLIPSTASSSSTRKTTTGSSRARTEEKTWRRQF